MQNYLYMKSLFITIILIAVAVLSWLVIGIEFFLLFIILISLFVLFILSIIHVFKKISKKYYIVLLITLVICLTGIGVALLRPYNKAILDSENISENLQYAYQMDQSDRKQVKSFIPYLSKLQERDALRMNQVADYYEDGLIVKPLDKFYSAFIYHHSNDKKDYKIASSLSSDAAKDKSLKENYQVQWLRKASYDRWMLSIGKPEIYNTQNKLSISF